MDILKTSLEWTKAEMLSAGVFVLAGIIFVLISAGFWQIGKTEVAKAFVIPTLVAGALLLIIGLGIFFQSYGRLTSFVAAYESNAASFIASELARADAVLGQYRVAVFKVMPLIAAVCTGLLYVFDAPIWRASLLTTIALMAVVMVIDTNANARLEAYKEHLLTAQKQRASVGARRKIITLGEGWCC